MMLETALAFERLIKNPKAGTARTKPRGKEGDGGVQITWDSVEQLEEYTGRLRAAAEKLTSENRRLRRCHADLVARVGAVMSVDLLRQPQRWKDLLMDIRHTMASLIQVCRESVFSSQTVECLAFLRIKPCVSVFVFKLLSKAVEVQLAFGKTLHRTVMLLGERKLKQMRVCVHVIKGGMVKGGEAETLA